MESLILKNRNYGLLLLQTDDCTSVAQHFVSKDGVSNFRRRVLRGGSAINSGVFSRASEDYVEKVGWNKMVLDAYKWVEYRNAFKPKLTPWLYVAKLSFLEAGIFPYNEAVARGIRFIKSDGSSSQTYESLSQPAEELKEFNGRCDTSCRGIRQPSNFTVKWHWPLETPKQVHIPVALNCLIKSVIILIRLSSSIANASS
ncbi:hypothetical protein COP1_011416 [Malus domestica]